MSTRSNMLDNKINQEINKDKNDIQINSIIFNAWENDKYDPFTSLFFNIFYNDIFDYQKDQELIKKLIKSGFKFIKSFAKITFFNFLESKGIPIEDLKKAYEESEMNESKKNSI